MTTSDNQNQQSNSATYAFLRNDFFDQSFFNSYELLDSSKSARDKEARTYLIVNNTLDTNTYLVPLRKNLETLHRNPKSRFKSVYYLVPSKKYSYAGLDFRKTVIANDSSFYKIDQPRLPSVQVQKMNSEFLDISKKAIKYIERYKKQYEKGRHEDDALYKYSALVNFTSKL